MKSNKMPDLQQAGDAIVELAMEIESIRTTDPERYARIISKLEQLEELERCPRKGLTPIE